MGPGRRVSLRRFAVASAVVIVLLAGGGAMLLLLPDAGAEPFVAPPPQSLPDRQAVQATATSAPGATSLTPAHYNFGYGSTLTALESRGRDTWYFWTAGNQSFFRKVAIESDGYFDLLQVIDSRRSGQRFRTLGVMTDPGCTPAAGPDEYGLWIDECAADNLADIPGTPTGVVGLRKFENPAFDRSKWSVERYLEHPRNVEPPYLVGMACGFCHIGPNPLNPPQDPERPAWSNLSPVIGNQYLEDAKLFTIRMTPDDFRWHVANKQLAGTVDTSGSRRITSTTRTRSTPSSISAIGRRTRNG